MLQPDTVIELVLPGAEAAVQAKVLSCSSTMLSVRLQELGTENVHRVSLKKLPYKVVQLPNEQQQPAGGDAGPPAAGPADQQQSDGEGDGEGGSSSGEEDDENENAAALPDQQQQRQRRQQPPLSPSGSEGEGDEDDGQQAGQSGSEAEDDEGEQDGAAAEQLDAFAPSTAAAVEAFAAAVEADPGAFLQPTAELAALAKGAAKALYDYQAACDAAAAAAGGGGGGKVGAAPAPGALPELYTDGFDAEQIWLQLELAAGPALKRARRLLKRAGRQPELLTAEMEEAIDELLEEQEAGGGEGLSGSEGEEGGSDEEGFSEEEEESEEEGADLADLDYDALLAAGAAQQRRRQAAAAAAASDSEEEEEAGGAARLAGGKRGRLSERAARERAQVEDEHFKLDEMEAFVQQAEREAAGLEGEEEGGGEEDEELSDEEAELEAALEREMAASARDKKAAKKAKKRAAKRGAFGEADDDMDEEEAEEAGRSAMFEDFFGPRRGGQQGPAVVAAGGRRKQQPQADELGDEEEEDEEGFEDDLLSDDMLSGEEEGEEGEGRGRGAQQEPASEDEEDEEDEEEDDEMGGWGGAAGGRQRDILADSDSGSEGEEGGDELAPSAHELRQRRLAGKIARLEEAALGDKDWFMRGEVDAARRPKNSALEVDLDFDTTVKPPPQPTEEMTASLDDLIKKRIAEGRFDDVVRLAAPPPDTKRLEVELDDRKPQQGLGEVYEAEYMAAVAGAADDKDDEVRQAARAQFSVLCAKLDALSHLHFTPRPVIEEVAVRVDVPAILMEEAAPAFVSAASMRAPEEVYGGEARGAPQAEGELERDDRKRRRAQRKRAGKKRRAAKNEERAARAVSQGGTAPLAGRKSAAAEEAARKLEKASKKGGSGSKKSEFSKSAKVFGLIQQHTSGATAAAAAQAAAAAAPKASHLKL